MHVRSDGLPTLSVVIPALNEQAVLTRCLDALHRTDQPPDEIVVVDNGSWDRTVALADAYPLVHVVREERRGITFARTTGFDASSGEIIARIDADTVVNRCWSRTIRELFRGHPDWDAIAGSAAIAELSPPRRFWFPVWYRGFRSWHERSIGVQPMVYGFNGAMRRGAWEVAREHVAMGDEFISEDVDLTIALLRTGHRIEYTPTVRVKARLFRSVDRRKLAHYYRTDGLTLARHGFGNRKRWILDDGHSS